jgi:hypothetical protein
MTRSRKRAFWLASAAVVLLLPACGSTEEYANEPRPPAPINVTAAITEERVELSPRRFGAGPIVLLIANQSGRPQEVTLETDEPAEGRPGIRQKTSPVNPRGTASLQVDVTEGMYSVSVESDRIRPGAMTVGSARASAQNDLLQP